MIYSTRLKKILEICLSKDEYVKIDDVASALKTSKRTIFREIKDIHKHLATYDITFVSAINKGITLEGSKQAKETLLLELQTQNILYRNKEERQQLLIFELLRSDKIEKLFHYAFLFQVSEATISNDLDTIETWLLTYHIRIVRKPGIGIEIIGKEQNVRKAMIDIVNQSMYDKDGYDHINYLDAQIVFTEIFMADYGGGILKLLNQDILKRILFVFESYQHELALDRYAQNSYIGLIIHLVIAIERILKNEEMQDYGDVIHRIEDTDCFLQATKMIQCLETEFDIDIPQAEIACIALHIKGAKTTSSKYNDANYKEIERMQAIIKQMFATYDEHTRKYLQHDEQLLHGLITHLHPTITRLKNNLSIFNPLLKQIKEEYSVLFEQTKIACKYLEKEYLCKVNEEEVGFITMHIGASIERMQHSFNRRTICIGVVCASGIGLSSLLSARIQKAISIPLDIHVLSMDEILHNQYTACELLISTFVLDVSDVVVLQVTPLLNCEDIVHMKRALERIAKQHVQEESAHRMTYKEKLQILNEMSMSALEILEHIHWKEVNASMRMVDIMEEATKVVTNEKDLQQVIFQDLNKREMQGSIIMKEYAFGYLHAKSSGITHSCVQLFYPKGHTVFDRYAGVKFIMVMLMPKEGGRIVQEMLSTITRALLDKPYVLKVIQDRKYTCIEEEMGSLLQTYVETKLNG